MQTPNDFLKEQLELNEINDSRANLVIDQLKGTLVAWGGEHLQELITIGSWVAGTAIRKDKDLDVDIMLSMKSDCPFEPKEMYESLAKWLKGKKIKVELRNISQRIVVKDINVDLIVAKRQPGNTGLHYVYSRRLDKVEPSDPLTHAAIITKSDRQDIIKLVKLWCYKNNVKSDGFLTSLICIESLKGKPKHNLVDNLNDVLKFIRDKFIYTKFLDPVNSNSVISDNLDEDQKEELVEAAKESLQQDSWSDIF